jgi:FtsZ-binding cell division protein ZapB
MAHVEKFTKAAAGHMFKHYERAKDENGEYVKFANQSIDLSKTHLNYNLAPDRKMSQGNFVKKRCTDDGVRCINRKDVNVMCSWIITAPKTLSEEHHKSFFEKAYKFLSARYGEENVVSAYVHMDETQPHIHFAFVPVIEDKKRGGFKVSAKELIGKKELLKFHPDLSKHMVTAFGYDVGIENGATAFGNQTAEQLKAGEELKKELADNIAELKSEQEKESAALAQIVKKKVDIKAVDDIEAKPTIFGDKVTVSADDFEKLQVAAKKHIVSVKSAKKSKSEIAELKQENRALTAENAELKKKSEVSIKLRIENEQLKQKVGFLQNGLAKVLEFIEKLNLKERLKLFLNPPRERKRDTKRREPEL